MLRTLGVSAVLLFSLLPAHAASYGEVWDNVQFCFWLESDESVIQKAAKFPSQGDCAGVAAGSILSEVGTEYLGMSERGLATVAAPLACSPIPSDQEKIVALMAACQCHNVSVQQMFLQNPLKVIAAVREWTHGKPGTADRDACDRGSPLPSW
ncbi:MAG: hypothetical protein EOP84_24930 [Verrucomicrobiaceae bacterium]|nr:MAG: hypothetical protein EOP84_24930 [Verrucomicrobiaceae bacterium]